MSESTTDIRIVPLLTGRDVLTDLLRDGARRLLAEAIEVEQPRVCDRRPAGQRETFTPAVLPPYLRRTKSLEELIPWLYLKGVSTGDFAEALKALLGPGAPNLSATTVTRLKAVWEGSQPIRAKTYGSVLGAMSINRSFERRDDLFHLLDGTPRRYWAQR